jgi:putative tryptophan/tyrosine transport system substrate-binding protein
LNAYAADDMREAVKKFRVILDQVKDSSDGVWLLLDNILPDKTIMPMALEAAWQHRVVLFSNNPSHTRRGALFALFPDNTQMGYSLAGLALAMIKERPRQPVVLPLSDLKVSINRRTASHIGLNYTKAAEEELDVIYPVR